MSNKNSKKLKIVTFIAFLTKIKRILASNPEKQGFILYGVKCYFMSESPKMVISRRNQARAYDQ